jgi:hypothetical protein
MQKVREIDPQAGQSETQLRLHGRRPYLYTMLTHIMGRAAARGRNGRNPVVTRWPAKPPRDAPDSAAGGYLGLHGAAAGASRPLGTGAPPPPAAATQPLINKR